MALAKVGRQPREGETILRCRCEPSLGEAHWFEFEPPQEFARPDLSTGVVSWLVLCESCHRDFDGALPQDVEDDVLSVDILIEEGGLDA